MFDAGFLICTDLGSPSLLLPTIHLCLYNGNQLLQLWLTSVSCMCDYKPFQQLVKLQVSGFECNNLKRGVHGPLIIIFYGRQCSCHGLPAHGLNITLLYSHLVESPKATWKLGFETLDPYQCIVIFVLCIDKPCYCSHMSPTRHGELDWEGCMLNVIKACLLSVAFLQYNRDHIYLPITLIKLVGTCFFSYCRMPVSVLNQKYSPIQAKNVIWILTFHHEVRVPRIILTLVKPTIYSHNSLKGMIVM